MSQKLDYNSVNWKDIVEVSEESITGLRWKVFGLSRRQKQTHAGNLHSYPNGKPKEISLGYKTKRYKVHRIIWVLFHGSIDENKVVDHIDGNPWNNSITNLRVVSQATNCRNSAICSHNKTKINGVSICSKLRPNGKKDVYAVAAWYDFHYTPEKYQRKHFRVDQFETELAAIQHAKKFLDLQIEKQKEYGIEFTDRHGK